MKTVKLKLMGGSGRKKLSASLTKEPELTVITEDELWAAFRAAHLAGETSPELDVMAKALDRAEEQLAKKAQTTVLNPFNVRGVSGPIIDGEPKKVAKGTTLYQCLKEMQDSGVWVCNAVDHDAPAGCSNPKCLKFKHLVPVTEELTPPRSK